MLRSCSSCTFFSHVGRFGVDGQEIGRCLAIVGRGDVSKFVPAGKPLVVGSDVCPEWAER